MFIGWILPLALGVSLEILVLYYLVRGHLQRFTVVFAYCLFQIFSSVLETSSYIGWRRDAFSGIYWVNDFIEHGLVALLVISLIRKGLDKNPLQGVIAKLLVVAFVAFGLGSFYLFHEAPQGRWMTHVSRNLSFGEEVLNLILWAFLIQRKEHDYQLLLVSAGIGIQVTGEVIGHTLRLYAGPQYLWIPNILVNVSEVLCLLIWIWAFRNVRPETGNPQLAADFQK